MDGRKEAVMKNVLIAAIAMIFWSSAVQAQQYETSEFRNPDSRIPAMFICMSIGTSTGIAPDAGDLVMETLASFTPTTPQQFDAWMADTLIYLERHPEMDAKIYWRLNCEEPFGKMRDLLSDR